MKNFIFSLFLLFTFHSFSFAQATSQDKGPGSFFSKIETISITIGAKLKNDFSEKMKATSLEIARNLVVPGLSIGGALSLLYLFFQGIKFLGNSQAKNFTNVIFEVVVLATVAAFLIKNYAVFINSGTGLLNIFANVAGAGLGGDNIIQFFTSILFMVGLSFKAAFSNVFDISVLGLGRSLLLAVLDLFFTGVFLLTVLAVTLKILSDCVVFILMGPFLFSIGLAFGPVLIPGLVTPWTRAYFTKWIHFLIASAVLSGVVALVFSLGRFMLEAINFTSFSSADTPVAINLAISLIFLLAFRTLVRRVPKIVEALVPA